MTALLYPVFTAESRALASVLEQGSAFEAAASPKGTQLAALLKAVLPDVLATPARMQRLTDMVGAWLTAEPRTIVEVETARQELDAIVSEQEANMSRILDAAERCALPAADLARLQGTLVEMRRLHASIFEYWQPYSETDFEASMAEVRQGKVCDLDEVIRELQGRSH